MATWCMSSIVIPCWPLQYSVSLHGNMFRVCWQLLSIQPDVQDVQDVRDAFPSRSKRKCSSLWGKQLTWWILLLTNLLPHPVSPPPSPLCVIQHPTICHISSCWPPQTVAQNTCSVYIVQHAVLIPLLNTAVSRQDNMLYAIYYNTSQCHCRELPWATVSYHELPWATMSYCELPWAAMSYCELPWAAMSFRELPWATMSYHELL